MKGLGALGATVLGAGCSGSSDEPSRTTTSSTTTATTSQTDTTEGETTTEEPQHGAVNFIPKDPDAEYADSRIFELEGEVDYEIDLSEARKIHYNELENVWATDAWHPRLEEVINNVESKEYRQQIINESDYVNIDVEVDWDTLSGDGDLHTRYEESNFMPFWHAVQDTVIGDISSANNAVQAAFMQKIEQKLGKDTLIWRHKTEVLKEPGHHGMVSAIENLGSDQETTYHIETVPPNFATPEHQVAKYPEDEEPRSDYMEPGTEAWNELWTPVLYQGEKVTRNGRTVVEKDAALSEGQAMTYAMAVPESGEAGMDHQNVDEPVVEEFAQYLRDPSTGNGEDFFDMMIAAEKLSRDVENWNAQVYTDKIEV